MAILVKSEVRRQTVFQKTVKVLKVSKFSPIHQIKVCCLSSVVCLLLSVFCCLSSVHAERIKDIATFSGVRENELIGYGLVVGLNGTGDKDGTYIFQPFANMLNRMGINVNAADIKGKTKNIAAVIVTAKLPTMVKPGSKVDVQVSSIGDAKSLQGGTLLMTPLKGADGNVYAVAQGPVSIGGFVAGGAGAQAIKNHPNVGSVPNGAIVEKEVPVQLNDKNRLDLLLTVPDITTAKKTADRINMTLGGVFARAESPSVVSIKVPDIYASKVVDLMSKVELINVDVDAPARVVVNERTGTIVIGENVTISPIALAHGGLTIEIKTEYQVSQPPPLSPEKAETVVVPQKEVKAEEKKAALVEVKGATIGELAKALNALGVTPKDLIAILQAIKASGNLKAELVIM
ncbi:flagellar basal body P-ring protein FlgI [Dissulfurispira thermophila]|uniref:Flagellar P-ring protein FlgI n=1 Tax=hot springs metagenome TaxID=433727 RepID=A0A5J4L6G6_9ZZZZ|nr:flagellar basal body P-ring protein FlgI [Dissulfurispira thermophila]